MLPVSGAGCGPSLLKIVLREGDFDPAVVRADAQRTFHIYGSYGISVFALRGATLDELAQQSHLVRFSQLVLVTGVSSEQPASPPRNTTSSSSSRVSPAGVYRCFIPLAL